MNVKKFLVTAGVIAGVVIAWDVASSAFGTAPGTDSLSTTVDNTAAGLGNAVDIGGSVVVGGAAAWALLLLFP
jgi:hypothetical protein